MGIGHFRKVTREVDGEKKLIFTDLRNDKEEFNRLKGVGHTVYIDRCGMNGLYFFEDAEEAFAAFEKWRREPCADIRLSIGGIHQPGNRLPLFCEVCNLEIPDGEPTLRTITPLPQKPPASGYSDEIVCLTCLDKDNKVETFGRHKVKFNCDCPAEDTEEPTAAEMRPSPYDVKF